MQTERLPTSITGFSTTAYVLTLEFTLKYDLDVGIGLELTTAIRA